MSKNLVKPEVLENLNWIRQCFIDEVSKIRELESLRQLRSSNESLDSQLQAYSIKSPKR